MLYYTKGVNGGIDMKKIVSLMVIGLLSLLIGCSSNTDSDNTKNNDSKNIENRQITSTESSIDEGIENDSAHDVSTDADVELSKEEYLNKCQQLEEDLNSVLAEKRSGTTIEMREAAAIEYEKWDDLLNEIYEVIIKNLSQEEANALIEEEKAWIETRDSKANEAASKVAGGTMEPLLHESSLTESTKERCYQLIEKYMK